MRFDQTIRNITSGDLGIPFLLIRPVVPGLKKTRFAHLPDMFELRGEQGQCDLVCEECLWMIGLMVVMLMSYSRVVSVLLSLLSLFLSFSLSLSLSRPLYLSLCKVDNYHHVNADDIFTKWLEANPIREKTALTVATFLYELMCCHGCFKLQIKDQGREFVNETSLISYTFCHTDRGEVVARCRVG